MCTDKKSLESFISQNEDIIKRIAKTNPTISKDDEWAKEDCWDKHYKELTGK